jgi:O-acetyl-ADP-ribose deacetylase (regulator of RNase III)/transcriptional regulator with XRE-family HTH domain
MPFSIIRDNLINVSTDVIVNATDRFYSGGGGVDFAIHEAAGPELFEACGYLGRLHFGQVKATSAYDIPVKYIFHTSGPHWRGGSKQEFNLLADCYTNSINLAREKDCTSIAFPLISSKGKHFPKEVAFTIAIEAIRNALKDHDDIDVYLVIYGKNTNDLAPELLQIIEKDYQQNFDYLQEFSKIPSRAERTTKRCMVMDISVDETIAAESDADTSFQDLLKHPTQKNLDKIVVDESFTKTLKRILKEKKLKLVAVSDELGMTSTGFWKIRTGKSVPTKMTVFGIAIALRLSIDETKDMLMKAGYAINQSSIQDVVLAGLIKKQIYDRFVIDDLLFALDLQVLPGAIIE